MEYFATLNSFYKNSFIRLLRLFIFLILSIVVIVNLQNLTQAKLVLFGLSLFFMNEIFVDFFISRKMPNKKVSDPNVKSSDCLTLSSTEVMQQGSTNGIVQSLLSLPQIQFLTQKATISTNEIKAINLDKKEILENALKVSGDLKGKYITTIDIFVAYLLLSEEKTKLLFGKKLKIEDLLQIAYWTRLHFPNEENEIKTRANFWGEGFGEAFVSGWTLETGKYTEDFTSLVINNRPFVPGRENEYREFLEVLSKKEGNNVILTGEVGAGKETFVEALAIDSFAGKLQEELNYKKVLELLIGALLAGVTTRGELEERLEAILQEVSHSGNIILYIPDFQSVLGSSSFGLDISDILIPYLRNGKMPIIGTMTAGNYKLFMENNTLKELFTVISLPEPDRTLTMQMLFEKVFSIEQKYKVALSYQAIISAVDLAGKYVPDTVLPGNAVILLEDVANSAVSRNKDIVLSEDVIDKVEGRTHIHVGSPKKEEKDLLLHLEENLHKRIVGQDGAIQAVAQALRRLRSGIANTNKPISFLFLGPTGVGKTETAKALSDIYFGSEGNMLRFDMSEYSDATGVMKLLGTPSTEKRGELTEAVHDHPFSLILLDEFEKASPEVLNLFLQVLEDGRLTDNLGKTVSFANTIIIATSNAASELIREAVSNGLKVDSSFQSKLLEYLQQKAVFKPELLNRFDAIVAFKSLNEEEVKKVVGIMLFETEEKLKKQDITLNFDERLVSEIAQKGYDPSFGARPLRRFIQDNIEDMLAKQILDGTLQRGAKVNIGIDESGKITTQKI
ncbi:MAG TPA: ATP-dependent Clp protease ATP-binding subunit [Patescibacteria group bacterium]